MTEEIKIEAIVQFNDSEAFVLNRKPEFLYEKLGSYLFGTDGPFVNVYKYRQDNFAKAFAGRKFSIPMKDGSTIMANGQYWDSGANVLSEELGVKLINAIYQTKENLIDCYVFTGASLDKNWLETERPKYTGVVYPYQEYEKIIKYNSMRHEWFRENDKLARANGHLKKKVKEQHIMISFLQFRLKCLKEGKYDE